MLSTELKKGRKCILPVIPEKSNSRYFVVSTEDGVEFVIRKLKFQTDSYNEQALRCYVKEMRDGKPVVSQDLETIISCFYHQGEIKSFRIRSKRTGSVGSYVVEDENGLCLTLRNAPVGMLPGNIVECRVEKVRGCEVSLKYQGKLSAPLNIRLVSLEEWLEAVSPELARERIADVLEDGMRNLPFFSDAMAEYDDNNPNWIFSAINAFTDNIPYWLESNAGAEDLTEEAGLEKSQRRILLRCNEIIGLAIGVCKHIIEGSNFLKDCNIDRRVVIRNNMTTRIELLKQYSMAVTSLAEGNHEKFIEEIFRKLRESGNLYHPAKRFRILMIILRLRPELIVRRMGELFEILHSWDRANWEVEPFRSALVDQLEIFIRELSERVDTITTNETGNDNKTIVQMILAIAIQLLLARKEDAVDLRLNRVKLYRYVSVLNPGASDTLLQKAVNTILGQNFSGEFRWGDTSQNPSLLIEKVSHEGMLDNAGDIPVTVKRFSTDQVDVDLRPDGISVVAAGADPDSYSLPNGMVGWLDARISVEGDVKTPSRSRKDIKSFQTMWNDIEKSLFPESQPVATEQKGIRSVPNHLDEVRVIIDDAKIFISQKTGERSLRYHCVIVDDNLEGEGWMTADQSTFLPWVSAVDLDREFIDLSIDFAEDESGNPLRFPATVLANNGDISFSMREQFKNYFIDLVEVGQESDAFVVMNDRNQPAMLCVSELGYTLQIPFGPESDTLTAGDVVRVRYLQRASSGKTYMEGEILDVYESRKIKKQDVLDRVMRGIGISVDNDDQETSMVMESEEQMSAEELHELALLFRRRAFLEKEYLPAFNYLGYARVLALCGGDEALASEIRLHQKLLEQLEFFAKNKYVDPESLLQYEPLIGDTHMLSRLFRRLKMLSVIGHPEKNADLWNNLDSYPDDDRYLASLVVSYNLLPKAELVEAAKEILDRISRLFNVNSTARPLHYFGQEGPKIEFKSSIVYTNRRSDHMSPNHDRQLHEILEIICGFMNSEGGTLYIGVNDTGYESGLQLDLDYFRTHRPYGFPSGRGAEASLDNMEVYLSHVLRNKLPEFSANMGKIEVASEANKGVLKITVNPSPTPVYLDNVLFVRDSSSTIACLDRKLEDFIANRERNYNLYVKTRTVQEKDADSAESTLEQPEKSPVRKAPAAAASEPKAPAMKEILTGRLRNNASDYWEPDYHQPEFVIHFYGSDLWKCSNVDFYEKDASRLRLAIHSDDLDRMIVTVDSSNRVSAVPVGRICNAEHSGETRSKSVEEMRHALIGGDDEYLLAIVKNADASLFYRIVRISDIIHCESFEQPGDTLLDNRHEIVACEVLDEWKVFDGELEKALDAPRNQFGVSLWYERNDSPETAVDRFLASL